MTSTDRQLMPLCEAWHLLGISRSSLYALIEAGKIKVVHIGRKPLVPADEIGRYVAEVVQGRGAE